MPAFTGHTTGQADFPHPALGQDFALARATLPALPGFRGTTNLSATPGRPACPSRASGWSSLATPRGFPCCVRFPCVHATATTPAQRLAYSCSLTQPYQPSPKGSSGRPAHCPFRRLLGVHSRGEQSAALSNQIAESEWRNRLLIALSL